MQTKSVLLRKRLTFYKDNNILTVLNKYIGVKVTKITKKDRILKVFIEAAKNQILTQGIENVSVRRVAEETGYSYATIYNYFKDLNALLWDVKKEMIQDLIQWMTLSSPDMKLDLDGIKQVFHSYVKYYYDNPNVFKFFYFYTVVPTSDSIENTFDFNSMWVDKFSFLMETNQLDLVDIQTISKSLIYTIHGILTLHFSQNGPQTYESVCGEIDEILSYLVQRKGVL